MRTAALAAVVGTAGSTWIGPARSEPPSTAFQGIGNAEGVRVFYKLDDFLVAEEILDAAAPAAQALVTDIDSVGYAAAPFPGRTALAGPGLASGALGAPLPGYPAYVQSSASGEREVAVNQPLMSLVAKSTAEASSASARVGALPSGQAVAGATLTRAEVTHDPKTGTTVSSAESIIEGVTVADVVRLGRVRASAEVRAPAGGARTPRSTFDAEGVTVAGIAVGVTDKGLVLAGTTTPLPDSGPVADVLRRASVEVKYLAPQPTDDGVVSAGLQITLVGVAIPGAPTPGDIVVQLGRASARATGGVEAGAEDTGSILSADGGVALSPSPTDASAGSVGSGLSQLSQFSAVPPATPGTGATSRASAMPGAPSAATLPIGIGSSLYVVLVLGGLAIVGASQLVRLFGVRSAWNR